MDWADGNAAIISRGYGLADADLKTLRHDIAAALRKERERCAVIADSHCGACPDAGCQLAATATATRALNIPKGD